jgi:hypothetical protein
MALIDLHKDLEIATHSDPPKSLLVTSRRTTLAVTRSPDSTYTLEEEPESQLVPAVLGLLYDSNSEVKNMAVNCVGLLVRRIRSKSLDLIIGKINEGIGSKEEETRDISCLGELL